MRLRGFSQQALAAAVTAAGVQVSQKAVSNWIKGATPRSDAAQALARVFGIDVDVVTDDSFSLPEETLTADYAGYKVTPALMAKVRSNALHESPGGYIVAPPKAKITELLLRVRSMQKEIQQLHDDLENILSP